MGLLLATAIKFFLDKNITVYIAKNIYYFGVIWKIRS